MAFPSFYNFIKREFSKTKTIKIILTEILVIIIVLFLLIQGLLAATFTNKILSFIILISFLSVSYLLIRETHEEIKRKTQAERLAQELKDLNKTLEERVGRRTKELKKSYDEIKKRTEELEKFYNLTVGRELKILELKKQIKDLKK
jgi:C4-dicarboxylate-specific signal transduction histidine kinase